MFNALNRAETVVTCRTGSLENIKCECAKYQTVTCRTGSLESLLPDPLIRLPVTCRTGSLIHPFLKPARRHSRAGGNPDLPAQKPVGKKFPKFHVLDSRLRGNDGVQ